MDGKYIITSDGNFVAVDELYHWGIKGMKWGVRRYQNADGTLTAAGKKRYDSEADAGGYDQTRDDGTRFKQTKKGKTEDLKADANRYAKESDEALRNTVNESRNLTNSLKNLTDSSIRQTKNNRPQMDLSNMSDKEMRDQINRKLLERQYNDLFAPQKSTKGREFVSNVLDTAGSVLAVGASALGIAVSIYTLREKMGKG